MDLASRIDNRTEEQFKEMLERNKILERYYAEKFIEQHNKLRHKFDYCLMPWGSRLDGVVKEYHIFNRPDYFLIELEDNKRVARAVRPLEICTLKLGHDGQFCIKSFKIDWYYCNQTKIIVDHLQTKTQCILCIYGKDGKLRYYPLFSDTKLYEQIKQRGRHICPVLGNKWAYSFYIDEVSWWMF